MAAIEGLSARINVAIEDARITISGGQVDIDVPRIKVALPRDDCTELTRRMMPEGFAFPAMEFGLGQRITGRVSHLRGVELHYDGNEIHFQARPTYRVQLDQKLPGLGWKKIAAISGKVEVPGLIRFRLANPGAALPDVEIAYEIVPGVPNILNIPDWAETTFKPDGQNLRDKIRELLIAPGADPPVQPLRRGGGAPPRTDPGADDVHRRNLRSSRLRCRRAGRALIPSRGSRSGAAPHVRIRSHRQVASVAKRNRGSQAARGGIRTAVAGPGTGRGAACRRRSPSCPGRSPG